MNYPKFGILKLKIKYKLARITFAVSISIGIFILILNYWLGDIMKSWRSEYLDMNGEVIGSGFLRTREGQSFESVSIICFLIMTIGYIISTILVFLSEKLVFSEIISVLIYYFLLIVVLFWLTGIKYFMMITQ